VAEPQINRFIHCLHPLLSYVVFVVCDIGRFSCTSFMLYVSYDQAIRRTFARFLYFFPLPDDFRLLLDATSGNKKAKKRTFTTPCALSLLQVFSFQAVKPALAKCQAVRPLRTVSGLCNSGGTQSAFRAPQAL